MKKLIAQKTMQNLHSQMMSLFDENDICVGEIHKCADAEHIVKCVNSHDGLVSALRWIIAYNNDCKAVYMAKEALKAAGVERYECNICGISNGNHEHDCDNLIRECESSKRTIGTPNIRENPNRG